MRDQLLAIDNGTQSVRALLFDLRGNLLAKAQVHIEPYFARQPGWAEQNPEYYWSALCQACQSLWAKPEVYKEAIAGVALTTQRATVINVDRQGKPLRPAIVWLDQRRTPGQTPLGGLWGLAFKAARMSETIAYIQAEAEANWIRTHEPEIWAETYKYLYLSGYLTFKLTGRFADSVGCQVGFMPFDYKRLRWASKWDWKWRVVPMDARLLPELVPPAGQIGEISEQAAAATGIPPGLPLIAAAADKACEVIGVGALEPHIGCLSYGTTATITTTQTRYIEPIPLIPPYPAAIPHAYNLEVQIYRGFWMVSWFKTEFGQRELQLAEEQGVAPEKLLDDLVADVPPGCDGLMLQPYWSPGLKVPGPEAMGAVIGFTDVHTRAHLYRAILEGLAYGLREGKERLEKRARAPITELRISGGGSQSDAAMQLTADIFGLPASRPHVYETSGLGAAIDAAVGLNLHPDFATAVRAMTRAGEVFEPNHRTHVMYDQLYRRIYLHLYKRLKPLYKDIREILGQ
ncbi:MAG: FGGY-family carbohydrate kinase [Caldilineaceae bacterium]|jgi:sugar (pentulose or hexulose) kinase|nr:FGGY-family carbohydrate kinase [Caldilineaceae bacterium]